MGPQRAHTGATGCGKTWLECALAQQAARQGFSVLYTRSTRKLQELHVAHGVGSFSRRLAQLARLGVLALDDLAIAPIAAQERHDLLELLYDWAGSRLTLITGQLPNSAWHPWLNEPTIADAIVDRLLHGAHTIAIKGESLRRAKARLAAIERITTYVKSGHGQCAELLRAKCFNLGH